MIYEAEMARYKAELIEYFAQNYPLMQFRRLRNRISVIKLARMAGVCSAYLRRVEKGDAAGMKVSTLRRIAEAYSKLP